MKKINASAFEGALYCLLFAVAALYVEARIRPQVLYYWNPELFLKTFAFFRDIALLPGGMTTYADKFLFQLNALPWLGTLSTVSLAFLAGVFANRIHSALTGVRSSFFTIVPLFFVLCTLNQFRIIPLTKLLAALVVADVFIHLPGKNAFLRVLVFLITSCFFILIVHDLYWLFAALCMISELTWEPSKGSQTLPRWSAAGEGAREARGAGRVVGRPEVPAGGKAGGLPTRQSLRREDRWVGPLYAVLAFAILLIDHRYLYLLHPKVESPGTALASAIQRGSIIEQAILLGLLLLALDVAYRKKSLSGLALLPLLVTGYVDLQTWSPSSKGLFCLLLGAPLLSALFSSRRTFSTRWPVWTRAASIISLCLLAATTIGLTFNGYWSSVLRLNLYSATQQWTAVLREVRKPSLADADPILVSPFILEALHHTGKLPDDLFKYRQLYPPYVANVTPETLREDLEQGKYIINLQQSARVSFDLGLINYAELTAYDVLEYRGDLLSSYQTIALVYLLKGNYEASRHFLTVAKQNLLSSTWADRYLAYADDPKRMETDDYLMSIKSRILLGDDPVDSLLQRPPFFEVAHRLVAHNPQNAMAREYLLSSYLLNGQVTNIYETFFQNDGSLAPLDSATIPRPCQEAVLVYLAATGQEASPAVAKRIAQTTMQDFMEYSDILQRRAAGYPVSTKAYPGRFPTTYVHYYTSLSSQRRSWANTVDSAH